MDIFVSTITIQAKHCEDGKSDQFTYIYATVVVYPPDPPDSLTSESTSTYTVTHPYTHLYYELTR